VSATLVSDAHPDVERDTAIGVPSTDAIRAVMLVFVDNAGVARMKCVPVERLAAAANTGVGMSVVLGAFTASDDFASVPGHAASVGDMRLVAELSTLRQLPGSPGWGWTAVDQRDQQGRPWPGCQRGFLQRMVERAGRAGLDIKSAFELEWWVGRRAPEGSWAPGHQGPSYGAAVGADIADLLLQVVDDLRACDIVVEQVHPEFGPGQLELSLPPRSALRACDEAVLARKIVRDAARTQGMAASFSPLPEEGRPGNGAHAHFSMWRDGRNLFVGGDGPSGLSGEGEAFLAGVLEHLPALTAIGAPCALSYARLKPSSWAGAYACWGLENREAALRLEAVEGRSALQSGNVEWKSVDTAANPYLVQGAILAAGLDGISRTLRLPPAVASDPDGLTSEFRLANRVRRLPADLESAIAELDTDQVLREAMGEMLFGSVLATRRRELEVSSALDLPTQIARYREVF
jgi:glutamine synthetase